MSQYLLLLLHEGVKEFHVAFEGRDDGVGLAFFRQVIACALDAIQRLARVVFDGQRHFLYVIVAVC